jgi:hypothetical protein
VTVSAAATSFAIHTAFRFPPPPVGVDYYLTSGRQRQPLESTVTANVEGIIASLAVAD